jgi:hypothetical protein
VRTEWPDFQTLMAYKVLALAKEKTLILALSEESVKDLQRLGQVAGVDPEDLQAEFLDHMPFAQRNIQHEKCAVFLAWHKAVVTTQRRKAIAKAHPVTALVPILQRFRICSGTTSSVELTFATRLRLLANRFDMDELNDELCLKVALERRPEEESETIGIAQELWVAHYGENRGPHAEKHFHAGMPQAKPKQSEQNTEASFLRARRDAVKEALIEYKGQIKSVADVDATIPAGWTPSHEKGQQFQVDKLRKLKLESYMHGNLLDEDLDDQMQYEAAEATKKAAHNKKDRVAKVPSICY